NLATYLLILAAIFFPGRWLARMVASFAPGEDALLARGMECQSVETRRRKRLPLRARFSGYPDRGLVLGMPFLVLLAIGMCWTDPWPLGVYVAVAPRGAGLVATNSEPAVVVQIELPNGPQGYTVFRVQGEVVAEGDLGERLKRELVRRGDWTVYIYGD